MSKEIAPGTLSFVDRLFLIFEKRINKKIVQRILILTILFLIFEDGMSKKIAPGILRFVTMLFLIFEKEMNKKSCSRNLKIRKYAFFNI